MNKTLVTIYSAGTFGVEKIEATLVDFGTKPYAQYPSAPFVHYIPKGKRKPVGFIKGYNPYIVIVEGHNHIDPADAFTKPKVAESGLITRQSRFTCFDDRYKTEFDSTLTEYIKDKKVLMDVRHTVSTNQVNKA